MRFANIRKKSLFPTVPILKRKFFRNSGKLLILPYTKGFGRITHFLGNDLATVLYTAFCLDLLFKQLVGYKCTKDIGTIIQKREKASTLL